MHADAGILTRDKTMRDTVLCPNRGLFVTNQKKLDISGTISPYCLSVVEKNAKALSTSGELFITCDNFPAVTISIPRIAREEGLLIETTRLPDGHWEIRLARK
ncbi:hypothetical protein Metfor_0611 [Methanoregula formicica SMSP]|uniref:Redox protein, regulator of disulfide bond formation n=2 Tax=Methanoregula formicica TaxID=882104 RepID=L0HAC8_METFS|nr:hypothetical protein Metfor_0611 [Methanoregula formicica SMSP]